MNALKQLAAALNRAVAEHGRPNSFGCRELKVLYGGPGQMVAGKVGRRNMEGLREEMREIVTYSDGRFCVH